MRKVVGDVGGDVGLVPAAQLRGDLGPREYIFLADDSVARFWGSEGIGGWRLDVGPDIDAGGPASNYWEAFRTVVRKTNPEAVIIGEEWGDASKWLLGKEWDATMNYRLRNGILGFVRDTDYQDNDSNGDRIIYPPLAVRPRRQQVAPGR